METQRDPYRILADLVFDICPNEEIKNFKRSVFGQEVTIKEEFTNYFKICGYKPLERYLSREALLEDPFWLNVFYEEFTPERPKFHNLKNLFERRCGKTTIYRRKRNPSDNREYEYCYLVPFPMEIKTPLQISEIIFSVVPREIMERTEREVRGMTFSLKDELNIFLLDQEYTINSFLTPEIIRTEALTIFSRGKFDFENPNFSIFYRFYDFGECLAYVDKEEVRGCTKSFREEGIETFRDLADIVFSVFTEEELKKHEETVDGRRVTIEDKFVEYFTVDVYEELRLNEYLTRDYIVKTVLIKIHSREFDIENPDFSAFFDPFFQPLHRFSSGVADLKELTPYGSPIPLDEINVPSAPQK